MAKLMTTYRAIERGSWKVKAEGKHGGAIGRSALRVLETFLFVLYRPGKALCLPYEGIAEAALLSRRTVPSAQLTDGFIVQPSTGSRPRPWWPRAPWPRQSRAPAIRPREDIRRRWCGPFASLLIFGDRLYQRAIRGDEFVPIVAGSPLSSSSRSARSAKMHVSSTIPGRYCGLVDEWLTAGGSGR
jgi:hypothetical protein